MSGFEMESYPTKDFDTWIKIWKHGASDWADGSLDWKFPVHFDRWHFPFVCSICKRGESCGVKLLRCNGCRVVHYCSPAHQKKAWSAHKHICKHMRTVLENYDANDIRSGQDWKAFLINGMGSLRLLASRAEVLDDTMVSDEWLYQRHCHVCFFNPASPQDRNSEARSLVACPKCYCAAHCSNVACAANFAALHSPDACESYMNGFASIVMSMQQGTFLVMNCSTRATSFGLPSNWNEYFGRKITDFEVDRQLIELPPVMGMLTDGLSIAMTLLHELTGVHGAEYMNSRTKLTVHLVGTEMSELCGIASRFEEMLHWLPQCKELEVVMVFGNQVVYKAFQAQLPDEQRVDLCAGCQKSRASMIIRSVCGLYHDVFTAESLSRNPPDVVLACHSGMHDSGTPGKPSHLVETWEPTVRLLTHTSIPCVYTSYNAKEAIDDRRQLVMWGARIVTESHLNAFRGLRPFPEVCEDNRFYYSNHSCVVTRGAVEL